MKKVGLFSHGFPEDFFPSVKTLFDILHANKCELHLNSGLLNFLTDKKIDLPKIRSSFTSYFDLCNNLDLLICIGGDGTFLEAVSIVRNRNIPMVGINSGHLGFLTNIASDDLIIAMKSIFVGEYQTESRKLIELYSDQKSFPEFNFALNEFTVHKQDTSSMIAIKTSIDGEFLNTYWADGLIISTPTGSTAYSLSVGGPIVHPESKSMIITPIAPHNLTVRPLIVPDTSIIELVVESRSKSCRVSLDHRSATIDSGSRFIIRLADFSIKMIKTNDQHFFQTLRNKLMWGVDKRN